jgi:hypothetical protein
MNDGRSWMRWQRGKWQPAKTARVHSRPGTTAACRIVELPYQLSIEQYPAVHFGSQKLMAFP